MNTDWNSAYKHHPYTEKEPHHGVLQFISRLKKDSNRQILDLGCGDGRHLIFLAKQGYLPVGVDNALWGLRQAKEWAEKEGLEIKFLYADMAFLPVQDECFDQIISIQVIHHQPICRIQKTLKNIRRLLREEGSFYFTVPKYPPRKWKNNNYLEIEHHTFAPTEGFEKGIPHHFFTKDELRAELKDFEIMEIKDDSEKHLSALVSKTNSTN